MKKSQLRELRKRCGDPTAICGIKDYLFNDGPSRGVRALDLNNGRGLEMTVLADRGLDVPYLKFKGINIGLLNKPGIRSPYLYQREKDTGFLRQFFGGMLTTCGLTHAGASGFDGGTELSLHGPYDNTPAAHVNAFCDFEGDDMVLRVTGSVREAELFGGNLALYRTLTLETERNIVRICDRVENQGFETMPLMLVYHINFGYPMLAAGARVYVSARKVEPRNEFAREGLARFDQIEEPEIGRDEQCYFLTDQPEGGAYAMLHNPALGVAGVVRFDERVLPLMCLWKCMRAGDYALGLEPTTSGVLSRAEARANGTLAHLEPGEAREFNVSLELTDDMGAIRALMR